MVQLILINPQLDAFPLTATRAFGPMTEIAPDAGIFESDITIRYTDGPASTKCPSTTGTWTSIDGDAATLEGDRFDVPQQQLVITVSYKEIFSK